MFDLFEAYTVSEINSIIAEALQNEARLQDVAVEGELSNVNYYSSGHLYYSLKDSGAVLRGVMWRGNVQRMRVKVRDGDRVRVVGSIALYSARGDVQIVAESIRPLGIGDLYARFEELRARLEHEGLFALERKRALPVMPRRIGIVTSREGAVFQDVQMVLRGRFPLADLVLSPTQVQGEAAVPQIVRAIERLNLRDDIDVILICRGGGSMEDLWAFNDERVVRAIVTSRIPVISGVGHETDVTLSDFAADVRAATPSNAAELATPEIDVLREAGLAAHNRLIAAMAGRLQAERANVSALQRRLARESPARALSEQRQRVDDYSQRLSARVRGRLQLMRAEYSTLSARLQACDPRLPLERGYAMVLRQDGTPVSQARALRPDETITLEFSDGRAAARVLGEASS